MSLFLRRSSFASFLFAFALAACGGSTGGIDPSGPGGSGVPGGGSGSGSASSPGSSSPSDPGSGDGDPSAPHVTIRIQGSLAPFTHADGFAGETPTREIVAVKSLYLLRSPTDPSPVKVFDKGASPVEADLATATPIELAKVPYASLPAGVFTVAKVGVAYVRYSVAARIHTAIGPIDGRYDNEQVLSEGAPIDGATRRKGWFRYSFAVGQTTYGTLEGENAPVPVTTTTGGITMDMSGPETFYVFPVTLAIDPTSTVDRTTTFDANVTDSFRWQDQATAGYAAGVFDTTTATWEPVMAFGANTFSLTVE